MGNKGVRSQNGELTADGLPQAPTIGVPSPHPDPLPLLKGRGKRLTPPHPYPLLPRGGEGIVESLRDEDAGAWKPQLQWLDLYLICVNLRDLRAIVFS